MNGLHVAFEGTLGQDAELRFTATGKAILNFSVAVTENRAGGDGAAVQWVKCALWEDEAERLASVLKKGVAVYCEGKLRLDRWDGPDGQPRSGLSASLWTCQPLGLIGRKAPAREREAVSS